jgi:uncharacterized protein
MDRNEVIAKLKSVEPQLRAHGVAALYLFGSYARDEARQDSDVDVFVDPGTQDFYSLSHFVGAYDVIRHAADGYTLLLVSPPSAINATLYEKLNFNFIHADLH